MTRPTGEGDRPTNAGASSAGVPRAHLKDEFDAAHTLMYRRFLSELPGWLAYQDEVRRLRAWLRDRGRSDYATFSDVMLSLLPAEPKVEVLTRPWDLPVEWAMSLFKGEINPLHVWPEPLVALSAGIGLELEDLLRLVAADREPSMADAEVDFAVLAIRNVWVEAAPP